MTVTFPKNVLRGTAISVGIALLATLISSKVDFNVVLLALIFGIGVGNIIKLPQSTTSGIKFSSSFILELSIVFMAFGINYRSFIKLGLESILLIVVTITITLILTKVLARKLKCPGSTGWLVGFGTAICGSSAIAALAPRLAKNQNDIGIALAVVNLYGLLGMLFLPVFASFFLTDVQTSVLLGSTLHAVGNVAGAGFAINDTVGQLAVTIKLGRIALLTPALLLFSATFKNEHQSTRRINIPWYLVAFLIISTVFSIIELPKELLSIFKDISSFLLSIAMAAIGLKIGFKSLFSAGRKGLIFGGILFILLVAFAFILIKIFF